MAELSGKEYWKLKEIEEEFLESVDPLDLLNYMRDKLKWRELMESSSVDIQDFIDIDNVNTSKIIGWLWYQYFKKIQIKRNFFPQVKNHFSPFQKILLVEMYS